MCCFSRAVTEVAGTRIFARMGSSGRQLLAYEMQISTPEPVAMILPVPTPPNSPDDAVRFISLETYPELFKDLFDIFNPVVLGPPSRGAKSFRPQAPLVVHEVGAFVASFVPSLADFTRLDPQFRVPSGTLDRVPEYADYGFVVFQLGATKGVAHVHPMALEFPTRVPDRLFFPLVHVHDGVLHDDAVMDHVLYAQGVDKLRNFETSPLTLKRASFVAKSQGLLDPDRRVSRCEMVGRYPNRDVWATLLDF
jgi:hypothetical protein